MSNFVKNKIRLIPLAAGGVIFLALLYSLGPAAVLSSIAGGKPGYIIITSIFFMLPNFLRIYKWRLMMDRVAADITLTETVAVYFSSKFWGMVSPMRSGEVIPALVGVKENSCQGKLLSIILYDRMMETAQSLMVFFIFVFLFYKIFFNASAGFALAGISIVIAVFSVFLFSKSMGDRVLDLAVSTLSYFNKNRLTAYLSGKVEKLKKLADEFYKATRNYFNLGFSVYTLFLTFICWAFDMLFWLVLFKAFSVDIGIWLALASVMVFSIMAAFAPIPGGLGAAELPFVLILKKMGYTGEAGGIIIAARVLSAGYLTIAYNLSNHFKPANEAPGD